MLVAGASACTSDKPDATPTETVTIESKPVDAAAAVGTASQTTSSETRVSSLRTINVHGIGRVDETPDQVTVTLGVETSGPNASEALKENNAKAADLIKLLKERGVKDRDVQTSNLSIYPQYDNTGRRIERYTVNNTVTATIKDVKGAGALIDGAATAAGDAIRVNGLSFGVSELGPARQKARTAAVKDGRAQAEELAEAAGVKLGKLRMIQGSGSYAPPQPIAYAEAKMADASAVPLEAGSQQVTVEVDLVYDIED